MNAREAILPLSIAVGMGGFLGYLKLREWHEAGTPTFLLVALAVVVLALVIVLGIAAWRFLPSDNPRRKLRDTRDLRDMIGRGAAKKGVGLRASIESRKGVPQHELACLVGRVGRTRIYKSWEDFTIVFMGPRSNKTSAVAVPRILSAPGAVVATSNKPDLWILTAALRSEVGPVYAFDPGRIAYLPQTWWWDILEQVVTLNDARELATHFVNDSGGGSSSQSRQDPFFAPTGRNVVSWMMLAASRQTLSMRDVLRWIDTFSDEPKDILHDHRETRAALALGAVLEMPHETRGGVFGQAATALASIQDEETLRWITPPQTWERPPDCTIEKLDLWSLFAYEDGHAPSLYLMSQEGTSSAGPVVAAIVARIFRLGDLAASAHGGRVDPPMTVVLDECANICRIEALPDLASHLGSKSICVDAIFQSEDQAISVWGRDRYGALWSAATVRIAGAGLQDPGFAKKLSEMVGTHKVLETNHSRGSGGSTLSDHHVREAIFPPEDVAAMKKTNALLIRQGSKPVLIDLMPWYDEPDSDNIESLKKLATRQVQQSAISYLGDANPVAAALRRREEANTVKTPVAVREL